MISGEALGELIRAHGFVVLDGGLATELEARGSDLNDPLWSAKMLLDAPQMLEDVNYSYLYAGADVSVSATYQATIQGFVSKGIAEPQARALLRQGVEIARRARDRFWSRPEDHNNRFRPLVVASIGPYGAYLHDGSEYRGHYGLTKQQLKDFHGDRIAVLVDSKPDLIAFESFPSLVEAEAVIELLAEFPEATCWISFTCKDGLHISEGTAIAEATRTVAACEQVLAVGVNCVLPHDVETLLRAAGRETDKPLVAYPNSGECFDVAAGRWSGDSAPTELFEEEAQQWYRAGARMIGGCCRTTPETIREVRSALTQIMCQAL